MVKSLLRTLLTLLLLALAPTAALAANNGNGAADGQSGGGQSGGNGNAGGNGNGNSQSNKDNAGPAPQAGKSVDATLAIVVPDEQAAVREAVKAKRALPLEVITALVQEASSGRILDIQLVSLKGVLLYDVTVIEADGLVRRLYYYARSGLVVDGH